MSVLDEVRERSLFDPQNKRLVMYLGVGAVGMVINQAITIGLPRFGIAPVLAGLIARIVSTLSNYVMNDSVTWRGRGAAGFGQWCWRGVKYVATRLVGIAIGPNQSASRSLLGRFVPDDKETEFYGFFAFSGKATAFIGPFLLGVLTDWSGSQRVGISVVIVLFAVGAVLLTRVDEAEGIRLSGRPATA